MLSPNVMGKMLVSFSQLYAENFISHQQRFHHQGKQICDKFSTTGNWYMLSQIQHHFHEDFPELDYVGGLSEELFEESEYCPLSSGDVSGISLS